MSETVLTLKKSNKENTGDSAQKVESFISKYRKIILAAFIAVVAAAVAVCTVVLLKNKAKNKPKENSFGVPLFRQSRSKVGI